MRRQFETQLNNIVGKYGSRQAGVDLRIRESAVSDARISPSSPTVANKVLGESLQLIAPEVVDRFVQFCADEAEELFKDIQSGVLPPDEAFNPFLKENETGLLTALGGVFRSLKAMATRNPIKAAGKAENAHIEAAEAGIQVYVSTEFATRRESFKRIILRLKSSRNPSPTAQAETEANSKTAKPVEQQAETFTAGGAASDELQKRVALLERHQKKHAKPLTKTEKIRDQRIKFCCSKRRKKPPETWNEIYHAYNKKFPNDKTASPDTLLHSHDRNCLKCRGQKS